MFDIIVAINTKFGIGIEGKIPWDCPEDRKFFRELTSDSILIMGRKTVESLPTLQGRTIFCISKSGVLSCDNNNSKIFPTFENALEEAETKYLNKKIFIAGGGRVYDYVFDYHYKKIRDIHISFISDNSECDVFFPNTINSDNNSECDVFFPNTINSDNNSECDIINYKCVEYKNLSTFTYGLYRQENNQEMQYINLLREILDKGESRLCRNGETLSIFAKNMKFDLRDGFPLLTTKKMFLKGIVEELLFFIRGETDSKLLEQKGVNIWKLNTNRDFLDKLGMSERREGLMGPMYGYQWRYFNAKYDETTGKPIEKGIDQLELVVNTIRTDPNSRRIIMTDFNPAQSSHGVLYPCHSILIQFYVTKGYIDMYCYNRSQDFFLGTPFNIASSALLLTLISKITNLTPRYLHMNMGDIHIYKQHIQQVQEQLSRIPYLFPTLIINKEIKEITDIENLSSLDISIKDYCSYPSIKADMIA